MIKYIDPSGREFDSVRSALRANNKERYMSGAICNRLKKHGHASIGGMVLTAVDDGQPVKEKITKPQASPLMNKLLSRYSVKELESIARGEGIEKRRMDYPKIILEGEHHRFVVMSDTHIGSIYSPEEWHDIVADYVNNNEIEGIFHLGDLVDGLKISRAGTQIYELSDIGYDAQKKKAIELMSKYNVPVYLISGNHDFYFKEFAGANICKAVSDEVDNVIYIGHNSADIEVGGVIVRLFHGGDGSAYAVSYRLQKLIEAITEGKKPDIILAGHVHKYCSIYTRGIHGISAPAMQMQTGFMQAKKLEAHTGFLLLEFDTENYRVRNLTLTYFPFDA